ncbi:MAG: IS21-like element ISPsy14 family transposase [Rhodanobacter sp.]
MQTYDVVRLILTTTLSDREIAASVGVSKTTVGRYRQLARAKALVWKNIAELGPLALQERLNRPRSGGRRKEVPDLSLLHDQLQAKGMTLQLLWEDYKRENPDTALCYSHLAAKLRRFRHTLPTVMRQHHVPGERVFVDYSGLRPYYLDATTGHKVPVELFVGVLGASSLMFAMCTATQQVPDFLRAHVAMFEYFGGLPQVLVPDNLKSAVTTAGKTPKIQRAYADLARHYGLAVLPTRPSHPRDKASVEAGVKFAQHRILARLRHQHFYSLDELNAAVAALLDEANGRAMAKDGVSRRQRFEQLERAALRPLPPEPYVYAEWLVVPTVPKDYHIPVAGHFYSVPHGLIGQRVEVRVTDDTVEVRHRQKTVAHHPRNPATGEHTTATAHQPEAHRAQAERTPDGMVAWAKEAGPHVLRFVRHQVNRAQPFQGLPACDKVRSLARKHGTAVLDRAAQATFELGSPKITTLKRVLDNQATAQEASTITVPRASHARGARYHTQRSEETPC